LVAFIVGAAAAWAAPSDDWVEHPRWGRHFSSERVVGTIAIADERNGTRRVFNLARARTRYIPASTFKIPHALFALDAGVARDEFQVFRWDSTRHEIPGWNGDQNLRSSMRNSTVWVYQGFARALGERRERDYLRRIGYGNADPGGGLERFWLDGALRISAVEQIEFLQKLYRNQLPFRAEHQRLVKDLMIVEAGRDWILRAKTGWGRRMEPEVGWWVGWVERPEGPVFFALNIDMPGGVKDIGKREEIGRWVLRSIHALPPRWSPSASTPAPTLAEATPAGTLPRADHERLLAYAGSYDTEAFLADKLVGPPLARLLGRELAHLKNNINVRGEAMYASGVVYVEGNAPHQGGLEHGFVGIEVHSGTIHAAMLTQGKIVLYSSSRQPLDKNALPTALRDWVLKTWAYVSLDGRTPPNVEIVAPPR
jgi:beta-lactamase class D